MEHESISPRPILSSDIVPGDLSFPTPIPQTPRAQKVARLFALTAKPDPTPSPVLLDIPSGGKIMLITGPSGSGKSTLLRQMRSRLGRRAVDLETMSAPRAPVIDCFAGLAFKSTLRLLSQVGLGEAWTFLRTPGELSEGQHWRLRFALAVHRACTAKKLRHAVLLCDEFAAVLDRVTAMIVAHALRKLIDQRPELCAIVATSHDDLQAALRPDEIIECDFGSIRRIIPARPAVQR